MPSYIEELQLDFPDLEPDSSVTPSQRDKISEIKKDPDRALLLRGEILIPLGGDDVLEIAREVITNRFILQCATVDQQRQVQEIAHTIKASDLIIDVWTDKFALFQLAPGIFSRLTASALLTEDEKISVRARINLATGEIKRTLADELRKIDEAWDTDE